MAAATDSQPPAAEGGLACQTLQVKLGGMHCSFCTQTIERALSRVDGVDRVNVSLAHEEALIAYDPARVSPLALRDTLRDIGYTVRDPRKVRSFEEQEAELQTERIRLASTAAASVVALWLMVVMWSGRAFPLMPWLMLGLAVEVIFVAAWPILRMAVASARRRILNQHVLLEFGALGGLAGGVLGFFYRAFPTPDFLGAAIFIATYHLLSGFVSLKVRTQTSQAVRKLMALQPPTARVIRDGAEAEVPIEEVSVGDRVRVRSGEAVPVDGRVVDGHSAVDESLVTGEPIPAEKTPGDEVIGGSLNQSGTLLVEVTKVGEDSFLSQVIRHVEEARALKPGLLALVDRILKIYVPGVLVIALGAFVFCTAGALVLFGHTETTRGIFAALAVGVMGYPCALGMATPLAMIRGGGLAAERGILMRSADAFQVFGAIDRIVLDKTGTLTRGKPRVVAVVPAPGAGAVEVLRLAAAVEAYSEHPLGRAVVERADAEDVEVPSVEDFEALTGRGVRGWVEGRQVLVGKPTTAADGGSSLDPLAARIAELEEAARTVVAVVVDGAVLGVIAIADPVKPDARRTVEELRRRGIAAVMLTGDNERTARAVAAQVGITEVRAQVLPDEKAAAVRELQAAGHRVAMVGDGINDAPALMQADVGIAIGAGTDIAIESSDVILVGERLSAVADAWDIGRNSYARTKQNLGIAFAFNGVGIPAATTGLVHPVWAMAAMVASVSMVLLNSFGVRLFAPTSWRRFRDPGAIRQEEGYDSYEDLEVQRPADVAAAETHDEPEAHHPLALDLTGVHCSACMARAAEGLRHLDGVQAAETGPELGHLEVHYKPGTITPADIEARLEGLGFGLREEEVVR
jgi:heavy metal translocating P-type ATPase